MAQMQQQLLSMSGGNMNMVNAFMSAMGGMGAMSSTASMGGGGGGGGAGGNTHQPGSWVCVSCQNVNFPLRRSCNKQSCGLPREQCDGGPPGGGGGGMGGKGGMQMGGGGGGGGAGRTYQEGSWVCLSCENVNFPLRKSCNKQECGLPREQCDGGPPEGGGGSALASRLGSAGGKGGGGSPEGSWKCVSCNNINWPMRTTCNNKQCGLPKPDDIGGDGHLL